MNKTRWVNLGPVGRPLGVHGAFFVAESGLDDGTLARLAHLRFGPDAADETVVEAVRHGAGIKLRVARITSPEMARTLQGKSVWADRSLLPPAEPGTYYHFDLLGLAVYADGAPVGTLHRIESVPGGVDRWWVRTSQGDVAVPAAKQFLKTIDLEARRLDVDRWDELLALDRGEGFR